jgi:hypothetical protein
MTENSERAGGNSAVAAPPDTLITEDLLKQLAKLRGKRRSAAIRAVGRAEWQRCAEDIMYWLDASRHPLMPYVYTLDPHPLYQCLICGDDATYHFNKRQIHLQNRHGIEASVEGEIRGYFKELPTTRVFPMKPYVQPIVDTWLQKQFVFVAKSRDMVATWLTVAMYTWDTLFHHGRQNIFQSEDAIKSAELVRRAWFIYQRQPKFLRDVHKAHFGTGTSRSGHMQVESINSEILGFPQGADQIRQLHPSGVFSDEAAFQDAAGDAFAAIKPAIQAGGRYTAVSSANPGWFYLAVTDRTDEA